MHEASQSASGRAAEATPLLPRSLLLVVLNFLEFSVDHVVSIAGVLRRICRSVSALACGITTPQHTITQLPYALIAAGTALLAGYLPGALGLPAWAGLLAGVGILAALTNLGSKPSLPVEPKTC